MKIKKFVAANMQEAMHEIRQELGPEAVIINTSQEPLRSFRQLINGRRIEVTAAVDDAVMPQPGPLFTSAEMSARIKEQVESLPLPRLIPNSIMPTSPTDPILSVADSAEKTWFGLVLQNEVEQGAGGELQTKEALVQRWQRLLEQTEVSKNVIKTLFEDWDTHPWSHNPNDDLMKVHLKIQISKLVQPAYERIENARIQAFVGPTGVGKTLTLAKMATRIKVIERKSIALIAIFNQRFGAVEKLPFYGDIIGVPVDIVMTPQELARAVANHRDKDVVFIDTDGRPSRNRSQVLELSSFLGAVDAPQLIRLILATPTKNRDLIRIARDFLPVGYNDLILTKTDETDTYGPLLNLICDTGIPVTHLSGGQSVPDDITTLNPIRLADFILRGIAADEDF